MVAVKTIDNLRLTLAARHVSSVQETEAGSQQCLVTMVDGTRHMVNMSEADFVGQVNARLQQTASR